MSGPDCSVGARGGNGVHSRTLRFFRSESAFSLVKLAHRGVAQGWQTKKDSFQFGGGAPEGEPFSLTGVHSIHDLRGVVRGFLFCTMVSGSEAAAGRAVWRLSLLSCPSNDRTRQYCCLCLSVSARPANRRKSSPRLGSGDCDCF